MGVNEVKALLDKYFAGNSSLQEERLLQEYFSGSHVDVSLMEEKAFFLAASDMQHLPETTEKEKRHLQDKLSHVIDGWNMVEKTSVRSVRRVDLHWIAGIAASLLFLFSFGYYLNNQRQETSVAMQDTYSDPRDAAAEAQRALMKFSVDLNKGLDKVSEATN